MASVHRYKRLENYIVQKVKSGASVVVSGIGAFFCGLGRALTRPYTVVLVPHSERRVYNLRITAFSLILFFLVLSGIIGAFFRYGATYNPNRGSLTDIDNRLKNTQASLDQLKEEVTLLLLEARNFEPALFSTLSTLKNDPNSTYNETVVSAGDLAAFFGTNRGEGIVQEVEDLHRLREYLGASAGPIREIGTLLESQKALLTEIPSLWPVKGGLGHITMSFGQNRDPFTGLIYIHKGIDITNGRIGDPIMATADGQVITVEHENGGLGNNVVIRHKHGIYTRYAHMLSNFNVRVGDQVKQGDVIGYVGNSGLSTGPHLHYEVHIGSDVVDPSKYINIRSGVVRTAR